MANLNTPFGFKHINSGSGVTPSFGLSRQRIAAADATPIYYGDPVMNVVGPATGYVTRLVPGTVRVAGIFYGCEYSSIALQRRQWSRYWPGADASGDVTAYVVDNPDAEFFVQGDATHFIISGTAPSFGSSPIGQYAQCSMGTGNAQTQQSGAFLNSVGTTATLPFIVLDLVTSPPGANGADPTSAFNWVKVGFNNQALRTNAAVTGIS